LVKLTELALFLPARGCQVGQLPVFHRQLQLAAAEAGPPGQAVLRQPPVGGLQRLPLHPELLELRTVNRSGVSCVIIDRM